jgi:hypothetical protein
MRCPDIGTIKFSKSSINAINDIKNRQVLSSALLIGIGAGTIVGIFTGDSLPETTYSIYSTDFKVMANAMASVPAITREVISKIAFEAQYDAKDHKEQQFWDAVREGCGVYR